MKKIDFGNRFGEKVWERGFILVLERGFILILERVSYIALERGFILVLEIGFGNRFGGKETGREVSYFKDIKR